MLSLVFVFTAMLFVVFILSETNAWVKYILFGLSLAIFVIGVVLCNGKISFRIDAYAFIEILFIAFALTSSLWAMQPSDSVIMARTLFRIFICAYMLYVTYTNVPELDEILLLKAVMWAGYIIAIYTFAYYGFDAIVNGGHEIGLRIDNEFANVNSIGLVCALSCMIQINLKFLCKKYRLFPSVLFMIPGIVVIAATQSRKALVFLLAGIMIAMLMGVMNEKGRMSAKIAKILFELLLGAIIILLLLQLDIFSGIRGRMNGFISSIFGGGKVDSSTILRNNLKKLGLEWFLKYPVGGIGIANPHILAAEYYNFDAYLHDNFVELLCGGGIVGFSLYYAVYVYLFSMLWKYRRVDRNRAVFFALWLMLMLVMDYGMVSYYSKSQGFYLMIHFVNIYHLKQKSVSYEH